MKKYFKILFVIIAIFIVTLGLNVNAEVEGFGSIDIYYPIHKTDEAGKALSGVQFTFSDVNGKYTLKSDDKEDGDYLIDYKSGPPPRREDIEERNEHYDNEWDNVIKFIPSEYQEAFNSIS